MSTPIAAASEEQTTVTEDMSYRSNKISDLATLTSNGASKDAKDNCEVFKLAQQLKSIISKLDTGEHAESTGNQSDIDLF